MICFRFVALVYVLPTLSHGIKINMLGSLNLGRDVVDTISQYVKRNYASGRRSLSFGGSDQDTDTISLIVKAAFLCRDLEICRDKSQFVDEYLITLTKVVEGVFEGLLQDIQERPEDNTKKTVIFEEELKRLLQEVKKLFKNTDEKITEDKEAYQWSEMIKRVSAKFQDSAITFAASRLEGNVDEISEVKKKLAQKLVIGITMVELKFEHKICAEYDICSKSHEVTVTLNTILEHIKTFTDDKAKEFVKYFYENLPDTNFYYRISDETGNEFQSILNDMSYAENIPTKLVLSIVQKAVDERLKSIAAKAVKANGRDVKLVHIILSDMDHFYSKQKKEPFHDFLSDFFEWSKTDSRFTNTMRHVMKDIQNMLSFESDELVLKLVNEVKVFMEITVDPEKN